MKKGLELLKSNIKPKNLNKLKNILGHDLPDKVETFLSCYKLGEDGFSNATRNFDEVSIPITAVEYLNKKLNLTLRLSHFYDSENLTIKWHEEIQYSDLYKKHNLLSFAYNEISFDEVYVNNKDNGSIWYVKEENIIRLEDDIFTFCLNLYETDILDPDFLNKRVFKYWRERFWRVMGENKIIQ